MIAIDLSRSQRIRIVPAQTSFKGEMGESSVILVKNDFFKLLHKFNLRTLLFDYLKLQTSITVVQSFTDLYHCCAVIYHVICKFLCHLNTL